LALDRIVYSPFLRANVLHLLEQGKTIVLHKITQTYHAQLYAYDARMHPQY
jgi:hypothetical protein